MMNIKQVMVVLQIFFVYVCWNENYYNYICYYYGEGDKFGFVVVFR